MMSTFNFNLETFERKIVEGREEIGEYLCQLQLSSQDLTLLSRNDLCLHTLQVLRLLCLCPNVFLDSLERLQSSRQIPMQHGPD